MSHPKIDLVRYDRQVTHWVADPTVFDFANANIDSRLTVKVRFASSMTATLNATGVNCDYLTAILRDYFVPETLETTLPPVGGSLI